MTAVHQAVMKLRQVMTVDLRPVQVGINTMTEVLVQSIEARSAGLIVYLKDEDEYQNIKETLADFQEKTDKPILICLNEKIELLNIEDLKRFGLQRIEM
ncbi:hypothetical protein B9T30_01655 [Acinetobacter sp. ANC 4973]|nr:hypothetical protein B9T30_01655 [Acinetobacter sp. ANC 4973]